MLQQQESRRTLNEIHYALLHQLLRIEESDGELTEQELDELKITETELNDKLYSYHQVVKSYEKKMEGLDEEMKRLQRKKKTHQSIIDRLKGMMIFAAETFGEDVIGKDKIATGSKRLKTNTLTLSVTYPKSVNIINEDSSELDKFKSFEIKYKKLSEKQIEMIEVTLAKKKGALGEQTTHDVTSKIDKAAIKKALLKKEKIDGAILETKSSLRIY